MADTEQRTKARGFHDIPVDGLCMFQVQAGVGAFHAKSLADITTDFVHRFIQESMVACTGDKTVALHYDDLFMLDVLLEMASALREAAGGVTP